VLPVLQSFEALNARAVAVVVDPVQSVKGKVVIDAFRLISPQVGVERVAGHQRLQTACSRLQYSHV
jgi:26S proteasome regulatory subunit N11